MNFTRLTFLLIAFLFLLAIPRDGSGFDNLSRIIGTQTMLIRHQATEYQRKVAEKRARAYEASVRRANVRPGTEEKAVSKRSSKEPENRKGIAQTKAKPLPRYIAVDTEKDKASPPKTKKAVMIWDTEAEALVGNNVYDFGTPPNVGSSIKLESYSAQYVAAGNESH